MAPSLPLVAALFRIADANMDEQSMLQMPMLEQNIATEEDNSDCRCPGYFREQCEENAQYGCRWTSEDLGQHRLGWTDRGNSNEPWCQCDPDYVPGSTPRTPVAPPVIPQPAPTLPPPPPVPVQAPAAECPAGWEQKGDIGADIGGCGLQSCAERYDITSEAACAARCDGNSACVGFSYAPMNGDRNHAGVTACTIYNSDTPTGTWTGTEGIPTQVFCGRAPLPRTLVDFQFTHPTVEAGPGTLSKTSGANAWNGVAFETRVSVEPRGAGPRGISFTCPDTHTHVSVGLQQAGWNGANPQPSQHTTWDQSTGSNFQLLWDATTASPDNCNSNACAGSMYLNAFDAGFSCRVGTIYAHWNNQEAQQNLGPQAGKTMTLLADGDQFKWYVDGNLVKTETGSSGVRSSNTLDGPLWVVASIHDPLGGTHYGLAENVPLQELEYVTAPGTPWSAPPAPVDDETWCAAQCAAAGHCCNDPSIGSNQQISCAQACMMRASGHRMDAMLTANGGICNRRGNSGCSLEVQGQSYSFCQSCQDLQPHCPHGVQSSDECDFGARLLPPSAVVDSDPEECESEWVFPGKGCPPTGACLNGNTPYATLEEAWAQCEQVEGCGNILHWTNGNYYLRRDTDPDWNAGHTLSHCRGFSSVPETRPECGTEQPEPVSPGKGCPSGSSCLNGNTPYSTLEEAWAQCEMVSGCGNILHWTDGNYYLRRDTDPDVTYATDGVHTTTQFCLGMIHNAPTPPASSQCTYQPGDGVGGTETQIGQASSREECAAMVREQCPYANGATLESDGSGRCYCEFRMSGWNDSPSWQSCLFEDFEEVPVSQCEGGHYVTGDGVGGTETYIGDASSPQECVQMVDEQCPTANGATLSSQGSGRCYCEFGMTDQNDSGSWQTCQFAFNGQMLKCRGDDHYQCASQEEAQQRCAEVGLNLCPADDIERHIGRVCAYMWTSDSSTTGYFIGNGGNGCGGPSNAGNMLSATATYGGVGMMNAACCD